MSESNPIGGESAALAEVRDGLARPFAEAMGARVPQVLELLEHQLAVTEERDQWKPLRGAIELIQNSRKSLVARVAKEVAERFDAKLRPGDDVFGKTARFSLDSLALVADEQVQEEIAIGNATKRLRDQLGDELFALTQRLSALMKVDDLTDDRNPGYPRIIARGLYDALAEQGRDSASRIAAFLAFGPSMLEAVGDIYHAVNLSLRKRGVLPDFKRSYGAPVQASGRGAAAPGGAPEVAHGKGEAGGAGEAGPAEPLERLFAVARARESGVGAPAPSPAAGNAAGPAIGTGRAPAGSVPAAGDGAGGAGAQGLITIQVRPELLAALRALETRLPAMPEGVAAPNAPGVAAAPMAPGASAAPMASAAGAPGAPAGFVPPESSAAIHRAKQEMSDALTASDVVVADIVAALFDRLFTDRLLSDATKAQVGRLQLPVFKAVIQDHSFFTDRAHPIRRLIDRLAELGAGEAGIRVDGRTPAESIAEVVQDVLDSDTEDREVFDRACRRLAGILERHHEAALEVDAEVLALRERERRMVALRESSLVIAHRLASANCSEDAASFLYRCWRQVMVYDFLDGGDAGPEWSADLEVLDDILWVLVPRTAASDRERLVSLLPSLIYRMKLGFVRAQVDADEAAAHVEELRVLLDEVMRSPVAAAHATSRKAPVSPALDDYTATLHVSGASLGNEGLERGSWLEFVEPDGERRRCRLTWLSPVQGTCVFKDLERNRSFAIALEELRERMGAGTAEMVDGPGVAQASIDGAISDVARGLGAG